MADETSGLSRLGLAEVVELLRGDGAAAELRNQRLLDALEHRVMGAISDVRSDLTRYEQAHGAEHQAIRTTSEVAHQRFDSFIAGASLDAARRDGALGITRLIIDTFGRNWKAIAALAAGVAAASGHVQISIGA